VEQKRCFQFHPTLMSTKKMVLIRRGMNVIHLIPPMSYVHEENGAHQTWGERYAFNFTQV
jgi:hypothetical protein